jgi:hypothetical protein
MTSEGDRVAHAEARLGDGEARAAGAEIVDEPADQAYGERRYHARDPEGHSWYFAQPLDP